MKARESFTQLGTQCSGYVMDWDVSKFIFDSRTKPQLLTTNFLKEASAKN